MGGSSSWTFLYTHSRQIRKTILSHAMFPGNLFPHRCKMTIVNMKYNLYYFVIIFMYKYEKNVKVLIWKVIVPMDIGIVCAYVK